jgi:hypothetical protein
VVGTGLGRGTDFRPYAWSEFAVSNFTGALGMAMGEHVDSGVLALRKGRDANAPVPFRPFHREITAFENLRHPRS